MYVHEHSLLYLTLIIVEFNVHLNAYRASMLKCSKAHLGVYAQNFYGLGSGFYMRKKQIFPLTFKLTKLRVLLYYISM